MELLAASRNNKRFNWSASYTYAVNEELVGTRWMPRQWDQRHTLYTEVTYVPARNWELSATWQFHTGWPYTDQMFFKMRLNNGTDVIGWYTGQTNALRASAYHRLDLRATRTYHFSNSKLKVFVDIWNAYNRPNTFGYEDPYAYISDGKLVTVKPPGELLPLLPSAGVSWEF